MPQGKWTTLESGQAVRRRSARALRPAVALSVLALLAACGQSTQTPAASRHAAAVHGSYNRPSSYEAPGPAGDPWGPWIREASRRFDVPERWVREVMRQESGGRVGATSPVGAMGLMQVMPGTYRELRGRYGLGSDPYHPYDSIMAGTAYLREMYDLYGSPAFLAAYNAGPRRLEDYLWNSRGLPGETRNYVARIGPNIVGHHPGRRVAPEIQLAGEIPLYIPAGPRRMDTGTMLALREQREAQQPGIRQQILVGEVRRMEPIPDGSTYATAPLPRTQIAALDNTGVVRMDPIPDGSTYPAPALQGEVVRMEPIPNPPEPEPEPARPAASAAPPASRAAVARGPAPAPARGVRVASLAAPPQPARGPASAQVGPVRNGLGVIGVAQAGTLPPSMRHPGARSPVTPAVASAAGGAWAVQVGAFANQAQARDAAGAAQDVAGGRTTVLPVASGRTRLFRARVTGLSQPAAQAACDRLKRKGACIVLSPDSQG